MMPEYDFSDRTLVLTGATGGIGMAVARLFHACGAHLFLIDLDAERLRVLEGALANAAPGHPAQETAPAVARAASGEDRLHLGKHRGRVCTAALDVSDPQQVSAVAEQIRLAFGGVDFLVPSAGIYLAEPFAEMTDEQWRRTLGVNLDGVFYLTRRMVPLFKEGSAIVNVSSMAAHRGAARNAHYSASKGALLSFTRSIARELGPRTRVNAVSPGIIETPMTTELLKTRAVESKEQSMLKRLGRPEEVASAIAFLCSDAASFITADVLHVNGGLYVAS